MSTLTDTAQSAAFQSGLIVITLEGGAKLSFPISENSRLACGTPDQLNNIEISPFGLHWPDLDEDLSIRGIIQGNYGRRIVPSQERS